MEGSQINHYIALVFAFVFTAIDLYKSETDANILIVSLAVLIAMVFYYIIARAFIGFLELFTNN